MEALVVLNGNCEACSGGSASVAFTEVLFMLPFFPTCASIWSVETDPGKMLVMLPLAANSTEPSGYTTKSASASVEGTVTVCATDNGIAKRSDTSKNVIARPTSTMIDSLLCFTMIYN
jgi:hypothetical protein